MLDKKKQHFFQLVFIFGAITAIALTFAWNNSPRMASNMSMMGQSMGNMMSSMHLNNITIDDLIRQQENVETAAADNSHSSHHSENNRFLKTVHILTTGTIIILLPFIIAGTVFLTVIWLK